MTTQLETTTPEHALQAATERLNDLRLRIGAGDPTATPEQFDRAERVERFARARLEMASVAEARDREAARLARIDEVRGRLPAAYDRSRLDKAMTRLQSALSAFMSESATFNAGTGELRDVLIRIGELPAGLAVTPSSIEDRGVIYRHVDPQLEVARAAQASFREHFPRHPVTAFRTQGG
ncbi:MAG: hypothetical protein ACR2OE_12045 [Thermomicrobiales bacterium]